MTVHDLLAVTAEEQTVTIHTIEVTKRSVWTSCRLWVCTYRGAAGRFHSPEIEAAPVLNVWATGGDLHIKAEFDIEK